MLLNIELLLSLVFSLPISHLKYYDTNKVT